MSKPTDCFRGCPAQMTTGECLTEIAAIFARGVLRLHRRKLLELANASDIAADSSNEQQRLGIGYNSGNVSLARKQHHSPR